MVSADATAIPATMMALRLHPPGGVDDLAYDEIAAPIPGPGEALVRVQAAAITRDELTWPADRLPAIPSYELSGIIVSLGDDTSGWETGADVFAMTDFDRDGVASDYAAVPVNRLAPKPTSLNHVGAAVMPLPGLSAMQGLFDHGRLEKNQRVLIHGGAGAVGSYAVQLARLHGAYVITTASGDGVATARRLGADHVIDDTSEEFTTVGEVDLVFDTVGGERLLHSVEVLPPGGRLVSVAEEPPGDEAAENGIDARWFLVESRPDQLRDLAAMADGGILEVPVLHTYPMRQAVDAFRHVMSRERTGKVVLVNQTAESTE